MADQLNNVSTMRQPDDPGPRVVDMNDHRFSSFINWLAGIGAVFMSAGGIWIISTLVQVDKTTSMLLDRPTPISKEQYDMDRAQMKDDIATIKSDVKLIQLKQAETINRRLP